MLSLLPLKPNTIHRYPGRPLSPFALVFVMSFWTLTQTITRMQAP